MCVSSSAARTYTQPSADGGGSGGVRGFAPAPPSSAHWLSGPSEESDNTLMTGYHLPQQQQGEGGGVASQFQEAMNQPQNPSPF